MGDTFSVSGKPIFGKPVDAQARCVHYHSPLDIIAIRFKCCGQYYPCFSCHEETAGHPVQAWSQTERNERAVLCGSCGYEMTISEYLGHSTSCPQCNSAFNPGCKLHHHLYFEL